MWLGGDPEGIRRSAAQLRALAETATSECAYAQRQLAGVVWVSAAAAVFQGQVAEDFALYAQVNAKVVDAAAALDEVANTLAQRQHLLVQISHQIGRSVEEILQGALEAGEDVLSFASSLADDFMNEVGDGLAEGLHAGKYLVGGWVGGLAEVLR